MLEFRVLGPVEVRRDGEPVRLGAGKQRAVLAVLVLNAGRVVSRERLIDLLWGERPPATAPTALHGHISTLRKALGAEAIATQPPGYMLRAAPDQIDVERFQRLRAQAREARQRGEPDAAARQLRAALALWRGEPLADVGAEPFVQAEAGRLDGLRLDATEERIDAELALGCGSELVDELERLVSSEPLRERLWAQLMLALYRAGRQADALDTYRGARQSLVSELGIEPGPELRDLQARILAQDPALGRPPLPAVLARRSRRYAVAGLVAVALVVAAVVVLVTRGGGKHLSVVPNSVAVLDPVHGRVSADIHVAQGPGPIAVGAGGVWVVDLSSEVLSRIDPRSRRLMVTTGSVDAPGYVAATRRHVWVIERCAVGGDPGSLRHVYTTEGGATELSERVSLRSATPLPAGRILHQSPNCALAAAGDSVWMTTNVPPGIARVDYDPATAQSAVVRRIALPHPPIALVLAAGSVWAADDADTVRRIGPRTGATESIVRAVSDPVALATGAGAVWVANRADDSVARIDPRSNSVTKTISVGAQPTALTVAGGSVWVTNSGDGTVSQIDPASNRVVATIVLGHRPQGVAFAAGAVWVTVRS